MRVERGDWIKCLCWQAKVVRDKGGGDKRDDPKHDLPVRIVNALSIIFTVAIALWHEGGSEGQQAGHSQNQCPQDTTGRTHLVSCVAVDV
jgi:hypothetical protein